MKTRSELSIPLLGAGALLGAAAWFGVREARRLRFPLHGRVALVTGGSRGLGFLIARELCRQGCRVAICARDAAELEVARERLATEGGEVRTFVLNVAHEHEVDAMVREIESSWGPVDVLVNNAGIIQVGPLANMSRADFGEAMAVNFWGVLHPTLSVLPSMRARGEGRIANVTSIGGRVSVPHLLPYGCAKFAAVGFSEGLRSELAGEGIRVTTVVPTLMPTGGPVNALFKGDAQAEFSWFTVGSSLRGTSIDPRRAARRIVRAIQRGDAALSLGWSVRAAEIAHALAPGFTADALGAVSRRLPASVGDPHQAPRLGMELAARFAPSRLTRAMTREAERREAHGGRHGSHAAPASTPGT